MNHFAGLSVIIAILALFFVPEVEGWGQIGHATIANTAWELMEECAHTKAYKYLPNGVKMEV